MGLNRTICIWLLAALFAAVPTALSAELAGAEDFRQHVRPILENYCFDCHTGDEIKGKVAFDQLTNEAAMLGDRHLWLHVVKNLGVGLMPPQKKARPTAAE